MPSLTPKFFGQYLLEKETLTKEQLIEAINYQKSKILKLGEIAVMRGYLTEKQVAKTHNEQKRTDLRFGDLAVQMGLLTQQKLEEMITIQKNNHVYLGEAIIACGYLDKATLDRELAAFKDEQKAVPPIEVMIKEDIPEKELVEVAVDLTEKLMRRLGDMISKSGQLRIENGALANLGVIARLDFKGDIAASYVINLSWDVAQQIAKTTFKKDDLPFDAELAKDTVQEFVNIVCGNIRAKTLADYGKKLDFQPPVCFMDSADKTVPVGKGNQAVVVPCYTQIGNYEIAVVTKE